jgi:hypothetical protein
MGEACASAAVDFAGCASADLNKTITDVTMRDVEALQVRQE